MNISPRSERAFNEHYFDLNSILTFDIDLTQRVLTRPPTPRTRTAVRPTHAAATSIDTSLVARTSRYRVSGTDHGSSTTDTTLARRMPKPARWTRMTQLRIRNIASASSSAGRTAASQSLRGPWTVASPGPRPSPNPMEVRCQHSWECGTEQGVSTHRGTRGAASLTERTAGERRRHPRA